MSKKERINTNNTIKKNSHIFILGDNLSKSMFSLKTFFANNSNNKPIEKIIFISIPINRIIGKRKNINPFFIINNNIARWIKE